MKKIIVLLFLFSYLHATAQEVFKNQYFLGINSGLNLSRLNSDPSFQGMFSFPTDQNFRSGYSGGLVFIYYSEAHKGIQIEFNYSQRGWQEDLDSADYSRKLEYLEFPLLSHFDIGKKNLNFSITLGPTISYLISSQEQANSIDESQSKGYYNIEIDNELEGGLYFGLGVNKYTGIGIFQVEGRLKLGLSNIFSKERNLEIAASQNQAIEVKISYLFGW